MRPIQNAGGEETIRARSYPVAKAPVERAARLSLLACAARSAPPATSR